MSDTLTGYYWENGDNLEVWLNTGSVWRSRRLHENAPWQPFERTIQVGEQTWRERRKAHLSMELPEGLLNMLIADLPRDYRYAWELAEYPEWQGYYLVGVEGEAPFWEKAERDGDEGVMMRCGHLKERVSGGARIGLYRKGGIR